MDASKALFVKPMGDIIWARSNYFYTVYGLFNIYVQAASIQFNNTDLIPRGKSVAAVRVTTVESHSCVQK